MALTKGHKCRHQISKTLTQCPNYGAKIKRTNLFTKIVAGFFGLVFLSILTCQCGTDSTPSAPSAQKATEPAGAAALPDLAEASGSSAERFHCVPNSMPNTSSVVMDGGAPKLKVNGEIINNMFGIHIYTVDLDPTTPQFLSEVKKVIERMSLLNIPILTFDIMWKDYDESDSVPENDNDAAERFQTDNLDAILDYAAEKKVYVIFELLTHAHWALPKWWKSYRENAGGYQLIGPPISQNETYNEQQSPVASYVSFSHRRLLTSLMTKLVLRYREHPAVIAWGINVGPTGENGYTPNYIELLLNKTLPRINLATAMADYSPVALENFRLWVAAKYVEIGALNQAWKTGYSSFSSVAPPYPKQVSATETFEENGDNRAAMMDWQLFRHDAIVAEWKFLSDTVKSLDPDKVIVGKTNWTPMFIQGSEFMLTSAASVNAKKLIDVDKTCGGIAPREYSSQFMASSCDSRVDHYYLSRFSKKYGTIRLFLFENWFMLPGELDPTLDIDMERVSSVKEVVKSEGCYFFFAVKFDSDTLIKPTWRWPDVSRIVAQGGADDLSAANIPTPVIKFYFDVKNLHPHYYNLLPGLSANSISFVLAKALFDGGAQPQCGFIEPSDLASAPPNPNITKLLILANQRVISNDAASRLKAYVDAGGTLLMLGSNGIFDAEGQHNADSLKKLTSGSLTGDKIDRLYNWGTTENVMVPFIVVSVNGVYFDEIPVSGNAYENYRLIKNALSGNVGLPDNCRLEFATSEPRVVH